MFTVDEAMWRKLDKGELDEKTVLEGIKNGTAMILDLFAALESGVSDWPGNGRLSSRELALAKTNMEQSALWLISDYGKALGSSITDGLRGL